MATVASPLPLPRNRINARLLLLALYFSSTSAEPISTGCRIDGPEHLLPHQVREINLHISKAELESLLGEADYSPVDGQFYFSTGGDCPLEDGSRLVSCGVVADFREYNHRRDSVLTSSLQSCWWGPIAE